MAAHAGRLGASQVIIERLLIVAGELATNAVRHGGGTGRVRLWRGRAQPRRPGRGERPGLPRFPPRPPPPPPPAPPRPGPWGPPAPPPRTPGSTPPETQSRH